MITDTTYSFFSSPDGTSMETLPKRPHQALHDDPHAPTFHPAATSVDSSYGFFSSPVLKEGIVKLEHPAAKSQRVEKMSPSEFVHDSQYTEFGI